VTKNKSTTENESGMFTNLSIRHCSHRKQLVRSPGNIVLRRLLVGILLNIQFTTNSQTLRTEISL